MSAVEKLIEQIEEISNSEVSDIAISTFICENLPSLLSDISIGWNNLLNILVSLPDRIANKFKHNLLHAETYFCDLCCALFKQDLESSEVLFSKTLEIIDKILLRRKPLPVVKALQKSSPTKTIIELLSSLKVISPLLICIFKEMPLAEIYNYFPTFTPTFAVFFTSQLPFKAVCSTYEDSVKLSALLDHYSLSDNCLINASQEWSKESLLKESNLSTNYFLTLLIYHNIHAALPAPIANYIFSGVQIRLSSTNIKIRNSGLLIASAVSQIMHPESPSIKFSLEDFLAENKIDFGSSDSEKEDEEEEITRDSPMYLEDLIQGLRSEQKDRNVAAINAAEELIGADLDELDLVYESLADVLFKCPNQFNLKDFEEKRLKALISLTFLKPKEMCDILISRLNSENKSAGSDILVYDVIRESANKLANPPTKKPQIYHSEKSEKLTPAQQIIKERLKLKTKRYHKTIHKPSIDHPNLFFPHFQYFSSGIIKSINNKTNPSVLSKAIYTLSEIIECTGPSCTVDIAAQCVYMIRSIVKPNIISEKREVVDSCFLLLVEICEKLQNGVETLGNFPTFVNDIEELIHIIAAAPAEFQETATKCLIDLATLQAYSN
ncbi:TELO2 [Blepharisma stoltei]|uniref:Telomere length regulation protein conserved domain-containing protein n=1 Tax=Blepharisma stoltei TaxID=1481888 RepID=A0AAU9JT93_9CILI|nr:unnamed protein product [Blepharisma stoltei]